MLFGLERVQSLELRMKGFASMLRAFSLDAQGRVTGVKNVLIPCYLVEDSAVSSDGKTVVLFGDEGTKILKVDLTTGEVSSLFKKTAGQAGFSPTTRIWYAGGHFFMKGYFYNSKGYLLNYAVAQLDLSKADDPKLFKSTWNLSETYHLIGKPVGEALISGNEGFLVGTDGKIQTLFHYLAGKLSRVDSEKNFGSMAAAGNRVFYTFQVDSQHWGGVIKDLESGKSWMMNPESIVILPYLSETGQIAVVGMGNSKLKFYYYSARQDNDFKLEPISNLQGTAPQILRLSGDGRRFAAQTPQGFNLETIP